MRTHGQKRAGSGPRSGLPLLTWKACTTSRHHMNLPGQALQKVRLALGTRLVSVSHSYSCVNVWVRDLKSGEAPRGRCNIVPRHKMASQGEIAQTCLCRFTGKTGASRNGCLIQGVLSKLEEIGVVNSKNKRFPCSGII